MHHSPFISICFSRFKGSGDGSIIDSASFRLIPLIGRNTFLGFGSSLSDLSETRTRFFLTRFVEYDGGAFFLLASDFLLSGEVLFSPSYFPSPSFFPPFFIVLFLSDGVGFFPRMVSTFPRMVSTFPLS